MKFEDDDLKDGKLWAALQKEIDRDLAEKESGETFQEELADIEDSIEFESKETKSEDHIPDETANLSNLRSVLEATERAKDEEAKQKMKQTKVEPVTQDIEIPEFTEEEEEIEETPAETKTESEPEEVMVDDDLIINDPFADEDDLLGEEKTETKGSEKEVLGDQVEAAMERLVSDTVGHIPMPEIDDEDDDYDYWFNFKSNGEKRGLNTGKENWKSNGKYYSFDERGVMIYEWAEKASSNNTASVSNWRYYNSPEDGARVTKGWFKVVAPDDDNDNTFKDYGVTSFAPGDAEDENERWYYANSDGELYVGQIKKIKGKYYGFAPEGNKAGSMLTGLCALRVDNSGNITKLWARDMDSDDLDDAMNGEGDFDGFGSDTNDTLYYFGNNEDSDGALKTGSVSVNLDGDNYQFQFSKTGGAEGKGRGLNGIDDSKYIYKFGMKLKAGSDDKYIVVYADGDTGASDVTVHKIDTAALRRDAVERGQNKDGDTVYAYGTLGSLVSGKASSNYYLLNTSGTIVKNKTAAKDGNDWYFYVDNKVIKMYTNNNTLTGGVEDLKKDWNVESKLISDGIDGDVLDTDMVDDGI